jgi:hypothetical protein
VITIINNGMWLHFALRTATKTADSFDRRPQGQILDLNYCRSALHSQFEPKNVLIDTRNHLERSWSHKIQLLASYT